MTKNTTNNNIYRYVQWTAQCSQNCHITSYSQTLSTVNKQNGLIVAKVQWGIVALLLGQRSCDSESWVRVLAGDHSVVPLGKLLTSVYLSPSSIIWYQPWE